MVIWDPLDTTRIKPMTQKSGESNLDEKTPLPNGTKAKKENEVNLKNIEIQFLVEFKMLTCGLHSDHIRIASR